MRRLIIAILLMHTTYLINCHALDEFNYYSYRGINLTDNDYRLFNYDDSLVINRHLVDSLLRKICADAESSKNLSCITIDEISGHSYRYANTFIIELANIFVKDDDMIPAATTLYFNSPSIYISKHDLWKLYRSFSSIHNIRAKDIIDVINLQKRLRFEFKVTEIEQHCFPEYLLAFLDEVGYAEALSCELEKISRNYKYGIKEETPCRKGYSILEDSITSVVEKIERIDCMIEQLTEYSESNDKHNAVFDARIKYWKHYVDSLQSLGHDID